MLSSISSRAFGPPSSVRTQPGAMSTIARGLFAWRAPKPDKDAGPIRDGTIDLEIGVSDFSLKAERLGSG